MDKGIVVFDPHGEVREGVVATGLSLQAFVRSGIVVLPCDDERSREANGGYVRCGWGEGWRFPLMQGTSGCPMIIRVTPWAIRFEWAAWLVATGKNPQGTIRMVVAPNTSGGYAGTLGLFENPPRIEDLTPRFGGYLIGGSCQLDPSAPGYLTMNLHATVRDVAVLVSAASHTKQRA